jgi:hypothetical protein
MKRKKKDPIIKGSDHTIEKVMGKHKPGIPKPIIKHKSNSPDNQ